MACFGQEEQHNNIEINLVNKATKPFNHLNLQKFLKFHGKQVSTYQPNSWSQMKFQLANLSTQLMISKWWSQK